MDPRQIAALIELIASLEPAARVEFAETRGIPPLALKQMEADAVAAGHELAGGSVFETVPAADAGGGAEDVSVVDVWAAARDKAWALGAGLAFLAAVPLVLAAIRARRGMSWRELLESAARLPFSD